MYIQPRSRSRPSRPCSRAATCWALPRPVPAKPLLFALPILDRLLRDKQRPAPRGVRALVLAPTRELAVQITDSFRTYGRFGHLSVATVVGGVSSVGQIKALARGVDVLVATPGRLLDHLSTGNVRLDATTGGRARRG